MTINSIIRYCLKLTILSGLLIGQSHTAAFSKTQCENPIGSYGMYYYKKQKAKSSAEGRWEKKTAIKHGIGLSFWNNAKKRSNICKKQANNTWRCFAIGTPCQTKTVCKAKLSKHGMWYYKKDKARKSAIGRWEKQAAISHNISYSFWKNAKSKHINCKKQPNDTWRCKATAKPCH